MMMRLQYIATGVVIGLAAAVALVDIGRKWERSNHQASAYRSALETIEDTRERTDEINALDDDDLDGLLDSILRGRSD